jgi:hypothetical protein
MEMAQGAYMIIGLEGPLGGGKTIGMVRYLNKDYANGNRVFANFGLRKIDYEFLNVLEVMQDQQLNNVSIGIDELTVFLDCRKSSSKVNRLLSYFILQTRKRNVNLYFTTQDFGMLDLRLMNHTHFQIYCDFVYSRGGEPMDNYRVYTIFDMRDLSRVRTHKYILDISRYYDYYDTNEIIVPPI